MTSSPEETNILTKEEIYGNDYFLEISSEVTVMVDRLESLMKDNESSIVKCQRFGNSLRVYSAVRKIREIMMEHFSEKELNLFPYRIIKFEDDMS